jgi:uncharacterized OB-fold protein
VIRPAPVVTDDSVAFWDAAREQRLVAQRCLGCGAFHHPPRPMCPSCLSLEHEVVELSGLGVVYSYAILHHPQHPSFSYPVIAILVELDEGVRIISNLVGADAADVRIGLPVRVTFEAAANDAFVPVFVPRRDSA